MSTEITVSAAIETALKAIAVSDLGLSSTDGIKDYLFEDHDVQIPQAYLFDNGIVNAIGFDVMFDDDPFYTTSAGEQNGANRTYRIKIEVYRDKTAGRAVIKAAMRKIIKAVRDVDWFVTLNCDELSTITTSMEFRTAPGAVDRDEMLVGICSFTTNELHPDY